MNQLLKSFNGKYYFLTEFTDCFITKIVKEISTNTVSNRNVVSGVNDTESLIILV